MTTDGQSLNESQLIHREFLRWVEFVSPNQKAFAQSTVGHHADDL
jgi:hypothetical protein